MQIYDVAAYHVRGFCKSMRALGIDVSALQREANLDPSTLDDPEARFPEPLLAQLWLAAERRWTRSDLLSLHAGASIPFGGLELIDYLVAACATVGEGIETLAHHASLCASGFRYEFERVREEGEDGMLVILDHAYGIELFPRGMVEYYWTALVTRFRDHMHGSFRPQLRLRKEPRAPESAYRRVLGDVVFQCARDELFIPIDQWQLENPRRDPMLATLLRHHARDVEARIPSDGDFVLSVRTAIADAIRLNDPSIDRVAGRLSLTPRTLQRRLTDCEQVYKQLVDDVRYELAHRYLTSTKLSLQEIGYLLAYSGPSAFGRAFRRWTTMTPAEYRAAWHADRPRSLTRAARSA